MKKLQKNTAKITKTNKAQAPKNNSFILISRKINFNIHYICPQDNFLFIDYF